MDEIFCFGIEFLGKCSLDHLTSSSEFNIGIYLGSLALLLAGYSILNEKHKFRIRFYTNKNYLIIFFLIGLIFSFIGYILPYIGREAIIIIGYPIFWEFISSIIYIIFLGIIWYSANTPIKVNNSNISKLTDFIIIEIAKGEEGIKIIGDELSYFFDDLIRKSINYENNDYKTLFTALGDNNLCKYIAKTSLRSFIIITNSYLSLFKEGLFNNLSNNFEKNSYYSYYRKIFNYSLSDKNSIIYREMNGISFEGINRGSGIYSLGIIENFLFIKELDLLSIDYGFELNEEEKINYYNTFLEIWKKILEYFFNNIQNNIDYSYYLYNGYNVISHILTEIKYKDLFIKIDFLPRYIEINGEYIKDYYNRKYGNDTKNLNTEDLTYIGLDSLNNKNKDLINVLSISLFNLLTSCARLYENINDEWYVRFMVNHLYNDYLTSYPHNIINNKLKELFLIGIKENLNLNLGTLTLPIFIDLFGFDLFDGNGNVSYRTDSFFLEVLQLLGNGLPKIADGSIYNINQASEVEKQHIIRRCEKGIQSLFINKESIIYNKENNKLIYYFYDKSSAREIDLNEVLRTGEINIRNL